MIGYLLIYKQWFSTDRSNLEKHLGDKKIVKKQHEFLRVKKASIKFDEAVLMLDFAENYSFVVQDCPKLLLE